MTGTQTFVIVMTCIFTTSAWFMWRSYQARKIAEAAAKAELVHLEAAWHKSLHESLQKAGTTVQGLTETCRAWSDVYERYLRSIARVLTLASGTQASDTQEDCPADKARTEDAAGERPSVSYADGSYAVQTILYGEGDMMLELEQDGLTITGCLHLLDEKDRASVFESLNKRLHKETLPLSMDLQLNVTHTSSRLLYATLLAVGMPREGKNCKRLR